MSLGGDSSLSVNERLGIMLASVVSFISIMCTVWYAAIAINNLTHAISTANTNIAKIENVMNSQTKEAAEMYKVVHDNTRDMLTLKKLSPKVLDISTKYVLMSSDGETFKLVRYADEG